MSDLTYLSTPISLILQTAAGQVRIEPWTASILRVTCTTRPAFLDHPSRMVLPREGQPPAWAVQESESTLALSTAALRLEIDRDNGAFTWLDAGGNRLAGEPARGGRTLKEIDLPGRKGYSARLALEFAPDEALYGLGQHEDGIFNYRGQCEYLYQHNMKIAMPVLVSSRGYAFFFDTTALSIFRDDAHGSYFWTEAVDEFDFFFLYGPEFDNLAAGMRRLTGEVPMFPRWAYGYIQSKERYKSQDELAAVVQEYRQRQIPLDGIVLDWLSWPVKLWGQKTFDPERFPDPAGLMDTLHRMDARLMISVWPKFSNDGPDQREMRQAGCLLGDGSTYNPFNPLGRDLYWRQARDGLFAHGIDAWWCDCTEPFEPDWGAGPVKPEPEQRLRLNVDEFKKYLDPAEINAYSLLHSQAMYAGQRQATGEKRVVNLTRSASPGQQRYAAIPWSGDIPARWETLRAQIPAGLNFTVTGSPRWTLDIGGFFVKTQPERWFWRGDYEQGCADPAYRELFVRWMQYGAFLPMFRAHGTDTPREVWQFGAPGEPVYEALVRFIRLRYRLLPYIYSLAAWEALRGYTMLRSLLFDFRADPRVRDIADQFMLGPALLVCPVTTAMDFAPGGVPLAGRAHTRPVYLPAGTDWYDFWTGERYAGGQRLEALAPLETIPLYVRAGSILPLGPVVQHANEQPTAPLEMRVYPGADGRFDLYEDEGDSYRCEQGELAWIPLAWDDPAGRFSTGPRAGRYRGMPERRDYRLVVVGPGQGVGINEAAGELREFF